MSTTPNEPAVTFDGWGTFHGWLQNMLAAHALTQKELAIMLNLSPQYVNDLAKGRREPTRLTIDQLHARLGGINLDTLHAMCGLCPPSIQAMGQQRFEQMIGEALGWSTPA